jgi:hypothetical protein
MTNLMGEVRPEFVRCASKTRSLNWHTRVLSWFHTQADNLLYNRHWNVSVMSLTLNELSSFMAVWHIESAFFSHIHFSECKESK